MMRKGAIAKVNWITDKFHVLRYRKEHELSVEHVTR